MTKAILDDPDHHLTIAYDRWSEEIDELQDALIKAVETEAPALKKQALKARLRSATANRVAIRNEASPTTKQY
tara:strand:- start:19290 stop:19508 length:219 start_codon:yes stop_codon:yes gene_type:complete